MIVKYLFASPAGDRPMGPEELTRPFKLSPSTPHPFLTLKDYVESIRDFFLNHHRKALAIYPVTEIRIRSEKHGALYHIASVELLARGDRIKFAVSTAVGDRAGACLTHDFHMLNSLNQRFKLPYLPDVYALGETERTTGNNRSSLVMVLGEWFEDYHEWHHAWDETARSHKIRIWNPELGQPFATDRESHEIFKQASKILTLYYDTETFEQIYPWHHAAGDFIIQNQNGLVGAKLTTVREYGPLGIVPEDRQVTPFVSIVYFFINLGLLMRIDRVDGVGKIVWAGDHSVRAVTEGFFQALQVMEKAGRFRLGKVEDLLYLLKSLDRKELVTLCNSVMEIYPEKDQEELSLIQAEMGAHVSQLNRVLQSFRLQDLKGGFQ